MDVLRTVVADLALAFLLLISAQVAAGWGELAGIRPGRDKSGLGGFGALLAVFAIRWLGFGLGLAAVARPGEGAWLLLGHAALGAASVALFSRGVDRVQQDGVLGGCAGLVGAIALPAPAVALVVQRANAGWLGDGPAALGGVALGVALLHGACYLQRRADMLRTSAAR